MEGEAHLGWGQGGLTVCVGTSDSLRLVPCQGAKLKKPLPLPLATLSKPESGWESVLCW